MARSPGLLLATCTALAACASPPEPLALPPMPLHVHYAPVAGAAATTGSPQRLHITVLALRDAVTGPPVDAAAALIASEHGLPFRGASPLPPGSRWLAGEDGAAWDDQRKRLGAEHLQVLAEADAVLAAGLVTTVRGEATPLPALRFQAIGDAIPATFQVLLEHTDAVGHRAEVHIDAPLGPAAHVLFVPAAAPGVPGQAYRFAVAGPAGAEATAAALAAARIPAPDARPLPAAWRLALAAVGEHNRRPALLALAGPLGLTRCVDLLLVADERALADITGALGDVDPHGGDVAWRFEHALWTALLPRLDRNELPAAMHAALLRHLGAPTSDSTVLRGVLDAAKDQGQFETLLRDENVAALADRDPALRFRSHDWLLARGAAVPDYAPFAPLPARRQALQRHEETRRAAETGR